MIYRCILPAWASEEFPDRKRVREGEFSPSQIEEFNADYYNIYYLPNYPSIYESSQPVDGSHIDTFEYVYVDMDLKEGKHANKDAFIELVGTFSLQPTRIVDSGNGVHVYWKVTDLDAMSFLRLQRRLTRYFTTDEAVSKIYQLMRVPGSINTKDKDDFKLCETIFESDSQYSCEDLDKALPIISVDDEKYCQMHYDKTYNRSISSKDVVTSIPTKFAKLLESSKEAKEIWCGNTEDRSKSDYRLGHIMFASGFTKEEATSVLVNSSKALARAPNHRINYAVNIIDKIWTYEITEDKNTLELSASVRDILSKNGDVLKGTRFPCWNYLDNTHHGFRLGQVIGLVAGSGVGKTAMALNMFEGFVENNPDYDHFFIPLEQPVNEIADRWKTMCGNRTHLYDKVHVISNYADDGSFRHLSFAEIKDYLLKFQKLTGKKIGCVVIDHIGALKKQGKDGENQDLMTICHEMKAFAVQTNTLLIMQSQSSREKSGIGDLELNKDAAYGTVYFESYCDYLITMWQPLKRCYNELGCPTITAFKFCKIRHKKQGLDGMQEDVPHCLYFDPTSEHMRQLTQEEQERLKFWVLKATNLRKKDRKTDVLEYKSINFVAGEEKNAKANGSKDHRRSEESTTIPVGQGHRSIRH